MTMRHDRHEAVFLAVFLAVLATLSTILTTVTSRPPGIFLAPSRITTSTMSGESRAAALTNQLVQKQKEEEEKRAVGVATTNQQLKVDAEHSVATTNDAPSVVEQKEQVIADSQDNPSVLQNKNSSKTQQTNLLVSENDASDFDYAAYWKQVVREMDESSAMLAAKNEPKKKKLEDCPKVYVYELSKELSDGNPGVSLLRAFSKPMLKYSDMIKGMEGAMRTTSSFKLSRIVHYRIVKSKHCVTTDPEKADLFYVPMLPDPKNLMHWRKVCDDKENLTQRLLAQLPHFNNQTACKHFFTIGKAHNVGSECRGWWADPDHGFEHSMRVAYSHYFSYQNESNPEFYSINNHTQTQQMYPNLFSAPYPSCIHWLANSKAPWKTMKQNKGKSEEVRNHFMLFVGMVDHGDVPVRQEIHRQCVEVYGSNTSMCTYHDMHDKFGTGPKKQGNAFNAWIGQKLDSKFCLEPGGDTERRKSIMDSIGSGCIPVFFTNVTEMNFPWMWKDWIAQGRVLVPRKAFVEGKIDLYTLLHTTMPPEVLRRMQQTLATYGRQIQYSLDEDSGDAMRIMLDGLKQESQKRWDDQGKCVVT